MTEKTAQKEPGKKPVPSKKPKPQQEVVVQIPLSELHPFPDHPFQVRADASMQETAESVKEYGVLVPALARPREDGGYELIAGHRRKHACELAGLATMPVIVRDIDRDAATIIMVDSNLQRENILPSERAQAYKMKLEAIRRKAGRPAKTKEKADENRLQSVSDQIPFGCIGFYIISRPQLPQSQGHTLQLPFAALVQELNPHCRFRFVSLQAAIQRYLPENRTLGECCFWLKESTLSTNRNFEFWMIEFILLKIVHRSMNH